MLTDELALASNLEIPYLSFVDASITLALLDFHLQKYAEAVAVAKSAVECLEACIADERDLALLGRLTTIIADASAVQKDHETVRGIYERFKAVAQRQLTDEQDPRILIVPLMSLARSYFLLGTRFLEIRNLLSVRLT